MLITAENQAMKYVPRVGVIGIMALALVGCTTATNGQPGAAPPEPAAPPATTEPAATPAVETDDSECSVETPCAITFRWWGGDDRQRRTLEAIELFEEQNPDIVVTPLPVSFSGYYDQLSIEFAAGTAPDVFQLDAARPREFGSQGLLLPLNDLLDTTYLPQAQLDEASYDGVIYAAPHTGNAPSVLLNADLFAEAGVPLPDSDTWTWDDFQQITADLSNGLPDGSWPVELIPVNLGRVWLNQRFDGGFFSANGDVAAPVELLSQWFDFMKTLIDDGVAPPASETVQLFTVGPEESLMGQNRSAIMFAPSSTISQMTAASGANLVLARFPGESSEDRVGTMVDVGIYYGASARTPHPYAAARLINFLVNDPDAGLLLGVDRGLPLNSEVAAAVYPTVDSVAQQQFDYMNRVFAAGGTAHPRAPGGFLSIDVNRAVEGVIFGQVNPDDAASTFAAENQASIENARG